MIPFATPMMAAAVEEGAAGEIEYVGGQTSVLGGSTPTFNFTSLTGGLASSPAAGDFAILIGCAVTTITPTFAVPSGWTAIYDAQTNSTSSIKMRAIVAWKVLGSGETSASLSVNGDNVAAVKIYRGVDPSNPFVVASAISSALNASKPNPPSIIPDLPGTKIVSAGLSHGGTAAGVFTSSDLSNFITTVKNSGFYPVVGMGDFDWESGNFDPAEFGGGNTGNLTWATWAAATMALRPA